MARRRTRRSMLRLRRKSRRSLLKRKSRRAQRGGMLEVARDYPWASVTTLNEEGVPQTQSVSSFYETSDANPDAPAETSV